MNEIKLSGIVIKGSLKTNSDPETWKKTMSFLLKFEFVSNGFPKKQCIRVTFPYFRECPHTFYESDYVEVLGKLKLYYNGNGEPRFCVWANSVTISEKEERRIKEERKADERSANEMINDFLLKIKEG